MPFLDSKEEVINIELTQHGKYLLSKGKFSPAYYAFFDEDVIYDGLFAQLSESQNSIQQRILNETPVLKPFYNFSGLENRALEQQNLIVQENLGTLNKIEQDAIQFTDVQYNSIGVLGTSDANSQYFPAWSINLISGTLSNVNQFLDNIDDGVLNSYLKIPQLNANTSSYLVDTVTKIEDVKPDDTILSTINVNQDNTIYLISNKKNIVNIFDIIEENTMDENENFDIEVFVEEDRELPNGTTKKYWKKLFFFKKPTNIKNNILLDDYIYSETQDAVPNSSNVEYYFELLVDEEIDLPESARNRLARAFRGRFGGNIDVSGDGLGSNISNATYGTDIDKDTKPLGDNC